MSGGAPICVCQADRTPQLVSRGIAAGPVAVPPVVGGLPHSFQGSPVPLQPLVAWLYAVHLLVVNWS